MYHLILFDTVKLEELQSIQQAFKPAEINACKVFETDGYIVQLICAELPTDCMYDYYENKKDGVTWRKNQNQSGTTL